MSLDVEDALRLGVTFLAFAIFVLALLAYRRRPTTRTLLLTVAFAVYAVKGFLLTSDILFPDKGNVIESLGVVADAVFLMLLAAAVLKS